MYEDTQVALYNLKQTLLRKHTPYKLAAAVPVLPVRVQLHYYSTMLPHLFLNLCRTIYGRQHAVHAASRSVLGRAVGSRRRDGRGALMVHYMSTIKKVRVLINTLSSIHLQEPDRHIGHGSVQRE